MAQLTSKPVAFFKPDSNQPRKISDESGLRTLGESLKDRQNDPVQAKPDGTLIDGERRCPGRACPPRARGLVLLSRSLRLSQHPQGWPWHD